MLDGDVPRATLGGVKSLARGPAFLTTGSASNEYPRLERNSKGGGLHGVDLDDSIGLRVITYNVCSLAGEGRLDLIIQELDGVYWDVVVLVETKRAATQEEFEFGDGHTFYGSGGYKGSRGVGFLVHERLSKHKFIAVSECLAVLELKCTVGSLTIIGVYMPDASYPDEEIAQVYDELGKRSDLARRRSARCLIAGDLNAQVGQQSEFDDPCIIGQCGIFTRTARGEWLAEWCTTHDFAIANTFTAGSIDDHWTYKKATIRKQLDYILVGPSLRKNLLKCKAEAGIDIGSDHRPVFADFSCKGTARKEKTSPTRQNLGHCHCHLQECT